MDGLRAPGGETAISVPAHPKFKLEVCHNILWSRYKGEVFSALHIICQARGIAVRFVQMAETEAARVGLSSVDLSSHRYPFELVYRGSIEKIPLYRRVPTYFWRGLSSRADFVILAGYSTAENWAQLAGLMLRGTRRGVFCDSTANDRAASRLKRPAKRLFFGRCDIVFCYGQKSREYVMAHGVPAGRIAIRCQAAALPPGYSVAAVGPLRRAHVSAVPAYLYVGRLAPEKNLDRLIEAFAAVVVGDPAATLTLVGAGPEEARLKRLVADKGLDQSVAFSGGLGPAALSDQYYKATCLVLPSLSEPWGLVVNEALSHGCPVLVSDRCGCAPELAGPGTGLVFDPLDVAELARKMKRMPLLFQDVDATTRDCLTCMAAYTPQEAAAQIIGAVEAELA